MPFRDEHDMSIPHPSDRAHAFVASTRPGYEHTCAVAGCGGLAHDEEHTGGVGIEPPQPRPVIAVVVVCCSGCPFVVASDDREAPWLCDAEGAVDGETDPRELPEQRVLPTGPPPPEWCPLRTTDRLVTLRLDAPGGGP